MNPIENSFCGNIYLFLSLFQYIIHQIITFLWKIEMNIFNSKPLRLNAGFTIIEIMVVVVIIGILAAIMVPKISSRPEQARMVKVKQDILSIESALDLYKLDNGYYPTTDQGLQALVSKPTIAPIPRSWKSEGYLRDVPMDPWGQTYQYLNDNEKLKIFSYGAKGKDSNSEIGNWNMNKALDDDNNITG
jgi:general secretion pathway protein G